MNNEIDVLVTESSWTLNKMDGTREGEVRGWIAFNMSSVDWAKYINHNVRVELKIIKDLGENGNK